MHATGLSYVKDGKIHTEKLPVPADQFPFKFKDYVNEDGNLYLVGHCRYSTSDLEYNQPIANDWCSVVHNGVVTQELPEHWKELYGYDCTTKNDTELFLHTIESGLEPLNEWVDSSMAVVELDADKTLKGYRNGKRPIYLTVIERKGFIFTSTKDIVERSGIDGMTMELQAYELAVLENPSTVMYGVVSKPENFKDLQYEVSCY